MEDAEAINKLQNRKQHMVHIWKNNNSVLAAGDGIPIRPLMLSKNVVGYPELARLTRIHGFPTIQISVNKREKKLLKTKFKSI